MKMGAKKKRAAAWAGVTLVTVLLAAFTYMVCETAADEQIYYRFTKEYHLDAINRKFKSGFELANMNSMIIFNRADEYSKRSNIFIEMNIEEENEDAIYQKKYSFSENFDKIFFVRKYLETRYLWDNALFSSGYQSLESMVSDSYNGGIIHFNGTHSVCKDKPVDDYVKHYLYTSNADGFLLSEVEGVVDLRYTKNGLDKLLWKYEAFSVDKHLRAVERLFSINTHGGALLDEIMIIYPESGSAAFDTVNILCADEEESGTWLQTLIGYRAYGAKLDVSEISVAGRRELDRYEEGATVQYFHRWEKRIGMPGGLPVTVEIECYVLEDSTALLSCRTKG